MERAQHDAKIQHQCDMGAVGTGRRHRRNISLRFRFHLPFSRCAKPRGRRLASFDAGLGLGGWQQKEVTLNQLEERLEEMEHVLDEKADASDTEWIDWMGGPDYSVTVNQQVQTIANTLEQTAGMLGDRRK